MTMPGPITVRLTLPLPPSVNAQYVTVGRKRVLSKAARTFKKDASKVIALLQERSKITPVEEKALANNLLGVYMTFYFETPMRRDLDGGLKIALDTIATSLGFDDRNVVDLHLTKQIDSLHPRLEIEIETISEWSFDRSYVYLGDEREDA
jgi:crossover junction endodeoxyribonuclease RusA